MRVEITDAAEAMLQELISSQSLDFSNVRIRATKNPVDGWRLEFTNDPWPNEISATVGETRVSCSKDLAPQTMVIDYVEDNDALGFTDSTT